MSEANHVGSRLPTKAARAVLIQRVSVCLVGDPDVVAAKISRLSFAGTSFEESVHSIANLFSRRWQRVPGIPGMLPGRDSVPARIV